ncbi:MAG: hypothetical protein HC800_13105 [Phormidesmis sp. RL_2_1]|nr:hypothetical protein [Phormidesmis sp. RL_2_1]
MSKKRARRPPITREFADNFSRKLEQLPAKKKNTLTTKELIAENVQQLIHLLDNGYSYEDLIIVLKEEGIQLTKPTLRQYLNGAKKGSANQPEPSREQPPFAENAAFTRQAQDSTQQLPSAATPQRKKFGKSRLQSDENPDRYPDGHGKPIEMKLDL